MTTTHLHTGSGGQPVATADRETVTESGKIGALPFHVEGSGPPLVLFHGGMGSWTHWVRNIPALRDRFTVFAPDLPGCGDGPAVQDDISVDEYLVPVCDAVARIAGGERVGIAGFSFGGVIASQVAARMPHAVRRLALLAPGGFGMTGGRKLDLRRMPQEPVSDAQRDEVIRHNLMVLMLARPESADAETLAIQRANVARARWDTRRFSLAPYTREALPRIQAPVMLVYGEKDNLAWPSVEARIEGFRSCKPGLRAEIVRGAGHWVQHEEAQAVNRLLIDFFTRDEGSP